MKEKQKLTEETVRQYCKARKIDKQKILDIFISQTGYNRKYAITVLNKTAFIRETHFNNVKKESVFITKKIKRKKRIYVPYYDKAVLNSLTKIWQAFDFLCGQRLVCFIRENLEYFSSYHEFEITPEVKKKLSTISSATIDRLLKHEKEKQKLRGLCTTVPAKNLNNLIPIRVYFRWDERKLGFFPGRYSLS